MDFLTLVAVAILICLFVGMRRHQALMNEQLTQLRITGELLRELVSTERQIAKVSEWSDNKLDRIACTTESIQHKLYGGFAP